MGGQFCWEILGAQSSEFSELICKAVGSLLYNTFQYLVRSLFPESIHFSSLQLLNHGWLFATPWTAACQASLSIINSQSLPKLMSIDSDALQPSYPLSYPSPPALSLSQHQGPSNEHLGLIPFRMDWLALLAVQGTLKSLLQHHSSKASIRQCSAFFIIQLSHPYISIGKTIALTRWTFVGNVSAF